MKIKSDTSAILCAVLLLAGCTDTQIDHEAEEQKLMQLSRDWSAIVNSGDIDAILEYWDEDATMLPPDYPMLEGKAAIRRYVESAASIPGFRITWEPLSAHVSESGDMAYLIERNGVTIDNAKGEPMTTEGNVVTVWERKENGEWKNVIDIWNTAAPAAE